MFTSLFRLLHDTPDDSGAAAPTEAQPEPKNIREAIEQRQAGGIPEIISEAPEAPAPVVDNETATLQSIATPPAGEAPTTEQVPAAVDPFALYGGREAVEEAAVIRDALATEAGVRTLVAQGLAALGHDPEAVKAFLQGQGASPQQAAAAVAEADPLANIADDDVVTGADMKAYTERQVAAAVAQATSAVKEATAPLQAQFQAQREASAQATVDAALIEVLGPVPTDPAERANFEALAQATLVASARFIEQDNWDTAHIRAAVLNGHAAMTAATEAAIQARLAAKRHQAAAQPANIGGTPPGGEEVAEPKNMAEARAMARASGIFG